MVQKDLLASRLVVPDSEAPKAARSIYDFPLCDIAKCQLCVIARTASDLRNEVTASNLRHEVKASNLRHEVTASNLRHEVKASNLRHEVKASDLRDEATELPDLHVAVRRLPGLRKAARRGPVRQEVARSTPEIPGLREAARRKPGRHDVASDSLDIRLREAARSEPAIAKAGPESDFILPEAALCEAARATRRVNALSPIGVKPIGQWDLYNRDAVGLRTPTATVQVLCAMPRA
jgi:Mg-chelatase subunit ChlI